MINRTDWEPFGSAIAKPAYDGIGYTGHLVDGVTALTYMQQRYYDAAIGRFLSMDPVGTSPRNGINFNRYWYASNNPYKNTDPDGRCDGPSTCAIDRDIAAMNQGKMSTEEFMDRSSARASGAAIGLTIVLTRGLVLRWGGGDLPEKIYRAATKDNPNHVKMREGEDAVSFRDSLSNPVNKEQATMLPGRNYIEVDTGKLPPGSVKVDGGKVVDGKKMPDGHVSVKATPQQIVDATTGGGKFPKE